MGSGRSRDFKPSFGDKPDSDDEEDAFNFFNCHPGSFGRYIDRNPNALGNVGGEGGDTDQPGTSPKDVLKIVRADYMKDTNTLAHNTSKYVHNSLIVRRAANFSMDLYFKQRALDSTCDKIYLEFSIGADADVAGGTKFRCPLTDELDDKEWSCMIASHDDDEKKIRVDVNIPRDAIIGRYKLTVKITSELEGGKKTDRKILPDFIVLFNPFSAGDSCFMEDAASRDEFVTNGSGLIYVGNVNSVRGRTWLFGQHEEGVLDAVLQMIRQDSRTQKNPQKARRKTSSPVYCSRVLAAMVNFNDDKGVLWGNWSGKYEGGTSPSFWSSSVPILKQWMQTQAPVKYGQCWVFSGLLTTALRAIGIPARSVTNFRSAHDTDANSTIDRFIDSNGEESKRRQSADSIWNFHVWNEAWFSRPDLPSGYDGWQVVDATPQEPSAGLMQCGPAPVKAIKNGEIYIGQDTGFVFSEVNADRAYWRVNDGGEVTSLLKRDARYVGRYISTKAVGFSKREDLTGNYKFPEGSEEERLAFERAFAHGRRTDFHDKLRVIEDEGAITIGIEAVGDLINGKDLRFSIQVANKTDYNRNVKITTTVNTILNNDEMTSLVKRVRKGRELKANEDSYHRVNVKFGDYGSKLVDENVLRVTTTVRVLETDKLYVDSLDVAVLSPPNCLTIKCNKVLRFGRDNKVSFVIKNPLPIDLTFGECLLVGLGVTDGTFLKLREPIEADQSFETEEVVVRPKSRGPTTLLADFDAKEINNIRASLDVIVQ